jgi:hypothetical protein
MRLSVVVVVVDGPGALERCLTALATQQASPDLEVIVPWDSSVPDVGALAPRFPGVAFLALGTLPTARPIDTAAGQHELFDRRRTAGLAHATAEIVALLQDTGVPRATWARRMVDAHARLPYAVIGGAVESGVSAALSWAVFVCDFNRYQGPFEAGPRAYVSDVNIAYKRRALVATVDVWRERYHETTVHWALQRMGETLYLTPECAVDQFRTGLTLGGLLRERFEWGRLFAYTRARELSLSNRAMLAALAPLLPAALILRHARLQLTNRRTLGRFVLVSPIVLLLVSVWCLGETVGYLTGKP